MDTSIKGLGACLLQDSKLVYFASKALTDAQKGYVVIELEALAVAWAMETFHPFLYASHFLLKWPEAIRSYIIKSLNQVTPRLQRILIKTFAYNFTVSYIPGSTNQLTDCVSPFGVQKDTTKLPKLHVHQITSQLQARSYSFWLVVELCLKYSQAKCKSKPTKVLGQDIPVHLWSRLATDSFHLKLRNLI